VKEELGRADFGLSNSGSLASGARVQVRMADSTAALISAADNNPERTSATVYGVRLFSDNSQNARENAYAAASQFSALQPDIPVGVTYASPHFLVTAGRMIDRVDAVALCGRVLAQFPKAMVVQLEIPLAELIVAQRAGQEPPAVDSLQATPRSEIFINQ
jgi:hypothetical protein